jgi:uncharacterized LabA/DUF88 family protein
LVEANYFSAIPKVKDKQDRFDLFLSANNLNPKFNLYLGKFLDKSFNCRNCNSLIKKYEEKETDIHIAVKMIRNVVMRRNDISYLISADSDLLPPLDFIKEYDPFHKVIIGFPPKRFSFDLKNSANSSLKLDNYEALFKKSLLPNEIILPNKYKIIKPERWK